MTSLSTDKESKEHLLADTGGSALTDEDSSRSVNKGSSGGGDGASSASREASRVAKISAAAFYAGASIMIMVVNKQVLTGYKFPSFQVRNNFEIDDDK